MSSLGLAGDKDRERAAPVGGEVLEFEVVDVEALRAECLEDPRENAGPVGDVDAEAVRLFSLASPIQRARKPASPSPSAVSSCSTRRRCSARACARATRLSRNMSTQIRGLAPATRVMSRNEPPAAESGSCPSMRDEPAWLSSTFASACGR